VHLRHAVFYQADFYLEAKWQVTALQTLLTKKIKRKTLHAMKAYRGSRGIDPLILNLGTGWR
jgi:hypothetical protein